VYDGVGNILSLRSISRMRPKWLNGVLPTGSLTPKRDSHLLDLG